MAILPSQAIFAGSSLNVTCVAEFDGTVDVPLMVDIILWLLPSHEISSDDPVHMENYTRYTRTFVVNNIRARREFICDFSSPYYSQLPQLSYVIHRMDRINTFVNISISK